MSRPRKYSESEVLASAQRYTSHRDWMRDDKKLYLAAKSYGIFKQATVNMRPLWKLVPNQSIEESARRFTRKYDWQTAETSMYAAARRRGTEFFKKVTAHMVLHSSNCYSIYAYEFTGQNKVYVGLTLSIAKRQAGHRSGGPVKREVAKGRAYTFRIISTGLDVNSAIKAEDDKIKDYANRGWTLLNSIKAGGIGHPERKHSKESCTTCAQRYATVHEWHLKDPSSYGCASRHGWYRDIAKQFPKTHRWPKTSVIASTAGFKCLSDWKNSCAGACKSAIRHGWYSEIASLFTGYVRNGTWNSKDAVLKDALKYSVKGDWIKNSSGAYDAAIRHGWLDEATSHMPHRAKKKVVHSDHPFMILTN